MRPEDLHRAVTLKTELDAAHLALKALDAGGFVKVQILERSNRAHEVAVNQELLGRALRPGLIRRIEHLRDALQRLGVELEPPVGTETPTAAIGDT